MRVSKSASVLCAGQKLLAINSWFTIDMFFCMGSRNDLFFSVEIDLLSFCAGSQYWLGFCMLADDHLVLV